MLKKTQSSSENAHGPFPRIVLVGTYKSDQLTKWRGWYNYPISDKDKITEADAAKITELWLFKGTKDQRTYKAEFVGIKTRQELIDGFGYPAQGKAHGDNYLLFKTAFKYRHKGDVPEDAARVIVRTADFATAPKIRKQLKAYLESPDRTAPDLAKRLPSVITRLRPDQLRVCEAAVQLEFLCMSTKTHYVSVWDKNVEVERSSYVWTKRPIFFNRGKALLNGKFNVLELFCGCGGTSLGFEMAGYQTVMGVDYLEPAIETFRANHKTAAAYLGDIRNISADDIVSHIPGSIDVVIAGIPCQGFSLNNRKRHDGDKRNSLYLELLRILKEVRPRAVVVENVSGIRSSANGEVVENIERGIYEACGLTVRHKLLNAADFGVPQRRARVVFVGVKDPNGFDFDRMVRTNGPGTSKDYLTVRDAIGDLPPLASGERATRYSSLPTSEYQRLMRCGETVLANHVAPDHPTETINKIARTKPGMPMYPRFRQRIRLKWSEQSPTQVSGGIRPQFQFGHPSQARGLTIRERCRIQSFPDSFVVSGGLVQGRVQTGNAVPPLLAKAVAEVLLDYLQKE